MKFGFRINGRYPRKILHITADHGPAYSHRHFANIVRQRICIHTPSESCISAMISVRKSYRRVMNLLSCDKPAEMKARSHGDGRECRSVATRVQCFTKVPIIILDRYLSFVRVQSARKRVQPQSSTQPKKLEAKPCGHAVRLCLQFWKLI